MTDDGIVKRLKIFVNEHGGQLALANAIGVDQGFISKVINRKQEVSYNLIRKLCFLLKYSPEWLIIGTGEKKLDKPDSAKLITEIQMLRTEVDILQTKKQKKEKKQKKKQDSQENTKRKAV